MPAATSLLPDAPTHQDYATDLLKTLSTVRGDSLLPAWAKTHLACAVRRALHAEATIALLRACNDLEEVYGVIDTSGIPV